MDEMENIQSVFLAAKISDLSNIVKKTKHDLLRWVNEIEKIELALQKGKPDIFKNTLKSFLVANIEKIDDILRRVRLSVNVIDKEVNTKICEVMQCTKLTELTNGITEAVISIQKTKELFKSKQLGNVRQKLSKLLNDNENSKLSIDSIDSTLKVNDRQTFTPTIMNFLDLTCSNISASIDDLKNISSILVNENSEAHI
ncbi:MAG: hypothetical protein ABFD79_17185, partial [Phycisphaerales bacterium]